MIGHSAPPASASAVDTPPAPGAPVYIGARFIAHAPAASLVEVATARLVTCRAADEFRPPAPSKQWTAHTTPTVPPPPGAMTSHATAPAPFRFLAADSARDLVLERVTDLPPEAVWAAWTTPELLVQWFTPAPWSTVSAELDLQPGGTFRTVMRSPEGEEMDGGAGCVLEVVPGERLAWTSALGPGFRPLTAEALAAMPFVFSAVITVEPHEEDGVRGTRYRAFAIHADAAGRDRHAEMGFTGGWGAAFDQLVALMRARVGAR